MPNVNPIADLTEITSEVFSKSVSELQKKLVDTSVEANLDTVIKDIREVRISAQQQDTAHVEVAELLPMLTKVEEDIAKTRVDLQTYKTQISASVDKIGEFIRNFPEAIDMVTLRMLRTRLDELEATVNTNVSQRKADEGIRVGRTQIIVALSMGVLTVILSLLCSAISIALTIIQLYISEYIK